MSRLFPRLVASGALLAASVLVALPFAADNPVHAAAPNDRVLLRPTGQGTASADLKLRDLRQVGPRWLSKPISTNGFSMVGLTWKKDFESVPVVNVRVRDGQQWGGWQRMWEQDDLPGVSESGNRDGTQPVWTGRATTLQIALKGQRPPGMTLAIIDPGVRASDRGISPMIPPERTLASPTRAPEPEIATRSAWGANPDWRNGSPEYNWTIKQVQIHHTAGSNRYSRSDVPAILRGIYRYHTHSLGWFDVGYNFLVDKFGRMWVGRSGGYRKAVRGAHTLGFNHMSVGISVIGSYSSKEVPREVIRSIIKLSAWKLDPYKRNPNGSVLVQSHGSDKYPAGKKVRLPVMLGHRATNDTACPGRMMVKRMDFIRWRTKQRVDTYS